MTTKEFPEPKDMNEELRAEVEEEELKPQENYLGCWNCGNASLLILSIRNHLKEFEVECNCLSCGRKNFFSLTLENKQDPITRIPFYV